MLCSPRFPKERKRTYAELPCAAGRFTLESLLLKCRAQTVSAPRSVRAATHASARCAAAVRDGACAFALWPSAAAQAQLSPHRCNERVPAQDVSHCSSQLAAWCPRHRPSIMAVVATFVYRGHSSVMAVPASDASVATRAHAARPRGARAAFTTESESPIAPRPHTAHSTPLRPYVASQNSSRIARKRAVRDAPAPHVRGGPRAPRRRRAALLGAATRRCCRRLPGAVALRSAAAA